MNILEKAGRALYGAEWHRLGHDLELHERSFRRMVSGKNRIPAGVVKDLEILLRDRQAKLDDLIEAMTT